MAKLSHVLLPTLRSLKRKATPTISNSESDSDIQPRRSLNLSPRKKRRITSPPESDDEATSRSGPAGGSESTESNILFKLQDGVAYVDEKELVVLLEDEAEGDDSVDDDASSADSEPTVPVRRLTDFALFECRTGYLINATELLEPSLPPGVYGASGAVQTVDEEEDDDEYEDNSHVRLLNILELSIHHLEDDTLDERIYIRTALAWYILDTPSTAYRPFYTPLNIRHRLTHVLLTKAMRKPRITYQEFIEHLDDLDDSITESDLKSDDVLEYVLDFVAVLGSDLGAKFDNVPLIKTLKKHTFSTSPSRARELKQQKRRKRALPQTSPKTRVTPVVGRIIRPHLKSPTEIIGVEPEPCSYPVSPPSRMHPGRPKKIKWVGVSASGQPASVNIDGDLFRIGDVVCVEPGGDGDKDRATSASASAQYCVNLQGRVLWFVWITHFLKGDESDGSRFNFHGQWFEHGHNTVLGEMSHSQELFLINECATMPVGSIYRKCNVRMLTGTEVEPVDNLDPNAINYFCQLVWDRGTAYTNLPSAEEEQRLKARVPLSPCMNCGIEFEREEREILRSVSPDGITQFGVVYHLGDFLYVKPESNERQKTTFVAQVIELEPFKESDINPCVIKVRMFKRDETHYRRIHWIPRRRHIAMTDTDGLCFSRFFADDSADIEHWIKHPDQFYYTDEDGIDVEPCSPCLQQRQKATESYFHQNSSLTALELFSGAGGLGQGLRTVGIDTGWAVEFSESAAQTFQTNHSSTHVVCADTNDALQYIVDREDGKHPVLEDRNGNRITDQDLPRSGECDLVCGGCPCQSFSLANFHKYERDPRNALPFNMLSFVEALQPNLFLLENVVGLVHSCVTSDAVGRVVKSGTVKLICRCLVALGYQVHFKILEAGQYGVAQERERLIFFAAKRGQTLPDFPIPTHAFHKAPKKTKIPPRRSDFVEPPKRSKDPSDFHLFAPEAAVTVDDAISDLPLFDWVNPHLILEETDEDTEERRRREEDEGILQFKTSTAPVGYTDPVAYLDKPPTPFQKAMRLGSDKVTNHVTDKFSDVVVERTTSVPVRDWANHRSLPDGIRSQWGKLPTCKNATYGRLSAKDYFKTAMTTLAPTARGSWVIHPSQKRVFSVREAARSQGFPDNYVFCSVYPNETDKIKDFYKQIGNAVPVPLAAALGRSLMAPTIQKWIESRPDQECEV